MSEPIDFLHAIKHCETIPRAGKVTQFYGLAVESQGPDVYVGEICEIFSPSQIRPVHAEVVGFRDGKVLLMPYGDMHGVRIGSEITATGRSAAIKIGPHLIGRVVDAFGKPIDGKPMDSSGVEYPLYPEPINPLSREKISTAVHTGVKSLDGFMPTGRGQRMGIFAGSGVGKSTLLGMIARNTDAAINVIALIGERGREVVDFIEGALGEEGLKRSIVVVAGADTPALVRSHAAYAATSIAEYFKDQGQDVLLLMDSVTRFAMAQREIGLAIGEPPTARGYTPSSFSTLPKLIERAGNFKQGGSITAFYTVLVEGDDFNEPVSDNMRAILDGHIVLTRKLANKRHYPAVDILESVSRLINDLTDPEHEKLLSEALSLYSLYNDSRDMIEVGAYESGKNPELDRAIEFVKGLDELLKQDSTDNIPRAEFYAQLDALLKRKPTSSRRGYERPGVAHE